MKCAGKNKTGENCKNRAMKDSKYCYVHSFMKFKGIPLYKNSTFHFLFSMSLAIVIFIYSDWTGATKENQEKIISAQEILGKTLEEIRGHIIKSDLIEYPGRCFIIMTRFYNNEMSDTSYIFDFADPKQQSKTRFSAYIEDNSRIHLILITQTGEQNQLIVQKGIGTFFFNERNIWFFEYGFSDTLSYLRITNNGIVIGEKLFNKQFLFDSFENDYILTIGGSYEGKYLNQCDLWFSSLTKHAIVFNLKDKRSIVNIIQESPLFLDPLPPTWAQLRGKNYLITDMTSQNKDLVPITID